MRKPIGFSILFHLVFVSLILWIVRKSPFIEKPRLPHPVTIVRSQTHGSKNAPGGSGNRGAREGLPKKRFSLGLVPKSGASDPDFEANSSAISRGRADSDGYETARRMGIAEEGALYPFFDALWRKVNAVTTYPEDFSRQRIRGRVAIQMSVDRRGVFTGEIVSVSGAEPMLNALTAATLIHALDEPLPEKLWMRDHGSERMLLVFEFRFELFGPGETPKEEEFAHFKNVLAFRRDAYVEPIVNEKIERFLTRVMPPILPIPGGFYIDFVRAYQLIQNLKDPTPDEDERRQRRLELKKEQYENLIQRDSKSRF